MLSRVVFFKQADGKVQMLESQKGATIDAQLTKPNIIASFPIVSDDGGHVGLNFNEGASNLLVAFDWNSSDGNDPSYLFQDRFSPAELVQRYVDEGKTDDKGRISIRQVAQVDIGGVVTAELRYFLQAYNPDPNYPALVSKQDFRWVGYFESSPTLISGTAGLQQKLSRFDPAKPLRYAVSSNTPEEVKQAVRDAILYWNRALGRDWIEVVDAPEGVTAPNLDYNLIQWVPEKGATFAFADAQLDPLTGEVTNAQVYFPSGWYDSAEPFVTDAFARRLQDLDTARAKAKSVAMGSHDTAQQPSASLSAKQQQLTQRWPGGCELINSHVLSAAAKALMKRGLGEADIKRIALDWVRSSVAHEVGHTLGLRHNFAGSLGSNIAPDEKDALVQQYFATGEWPADKVPGSSVMEYPAFEDDVAIGAHIRLGYPALAYDRAAIGALYNGTPLPDKGPLFCTDSESGLIAGCTSNDSGADLIASLRQEIQDDVKNAAVEYVYYIRVAKRAEASDLFAGTAADLDAAASYGKRAQVAQLLSSHSRLLTADRVVGSPSINEAEIHKASLKAVGRSIVAAGGYDDFFGLLPEDFDDHFYAQLDELLAAPWITSGTTQNGGSWQLTAAEIEAVRDYAPRYLSAYHKAAAASDIATLSLQDPTLAALLESLPPDVIIIGGPETGGTWEPPVYAEELQQLLADRAEYYATATSGEFTAKVSVHASGEPEAEPPSTPNTPGTPSTPEKKPKHAASGETPAPREPSDEDDGDNSSAPVTRKLTLPNFTYSTELRSSVSQILSAANSEDRLWLRELRAQPGKALSALLNDAAGGSFSDLEVDGSDPKAQRWILDNQDVLSSVGGDASASDVEESSEAPAP